MKKNSLIIIMMAFLLSWGGAFAQEIIMSPGTQSVCAGTFKDPGGDSDYNTSEDIEMTLCSATAGMEISVEFTAFDTESGWDDLTIYQGTGIGGTLIGTYDGNALLGQTIVSTGSGCLTFVWHSDGSVVRAGWEATVTCVSGCQQFTANTTLNGGAFPATINLCVGEQIDVTAVGVYPNNDVDYHQEDATSIFTWDFGNNTVVSANASNTYGTQGAYTLTLTVEDINGCLYTETYPVNVTCGGGCPACTDILPTDPDPTTCTGTFWDTGMNADYSNSEDEEITICPDGPGQAVNVNFIEFETESCCDHMWIYDGNSTASPLITGLGGSTDDDYDGTQLAGITVTSTSGDGCLTFVWHSDGSVTRPGWIGDLFCSTGCQEFDVSSTANSAPITGTVGVCIGEQIDFSSTATFPNNDINYHQDVTTCTFDWDFGNGSTASGQDVNITYNTQGTYTVTLTVNDVNNCPIIETYTVEVNCGGACPVCTDIFPADPDVNTCVGTFWDSGLTGDYTANENDTITICSDNGGFIQFHFNEFALENSTWSDDDKLFVFDGPDVNAPMMGIYNNANPVPTDIVSAGTCLTFVFKSDQWSTPGAGWSAEISCAEPCQEMELDVVTSIAPDAQGIVHSCPGGSIDFAATVSFPNNDVDYHQEMATTTISWSAYNGATGTGATFTLPTDSAFNTFVMIDVMDVNGCHYYDTISVVSECQAIDVEIVTDATIAQNGEIFLMDASTPISFDGVYAFPENGDCYAQTVNEFTWTFGISDVSNGDLIESHVEDTVVQFPNNGVFEVVFTVEDQEGCSNQITTEVHVGCQPIDVTWTGTPAMIGDTIIVCPGDSFSIEIFTDYFANNEIYYQDDANMIFNWNMGDGTLIPNQMNPGMHSYTEAGLYNVYLQIVDTNNSGTVPCPDNTYIPVYSFMEPSFAGTHMETDTICFGDSLLLFGNTTLDMPSYSAPPVFLPDGSGVSYTSTLTFDMFGDEILTDVSDFMSICMNLEHSYTGDLELLLECPNGQFVELLPYPNGCGSNHLGEPCDWGVTSTTGTGYDYCFTPTAATTIPDNANIYNHTFIDNDGNSITNNYFPAGDYAPTGTFDDLLGCPLNGDWELQITDNLGSDDGMIFDWSITLNVDGLIPPDTTQLPLDMREWTVETGGDAVINVFEEDDSYATPLDTGIYTFTFTTISPAGCEYSTTVGPLYVAPLPEIVLGNDTSLCASYDYTIPGSLTNGTGTWSYTGPGNATFSSMNTIPVDVTVDTYGDYTFYFTPQTISMCAIPDSITVSFHELPTVDHLIDSTTCFGYCDGSITVTPTGVELPYNYVWSNGDTSNVASSLCEGDYQVTVYTDYCFNSYAYNVPQPTEVVVVDSGRVDNLCFADSNGEVWVSVEGGIPGYTYTWDPTNPNDSMITGLADGTYRVTVTDQNGCTATAAETVNGPSNILSINDIVPTHIACFGESNGSLQTQVSGGTPPYEYNWILAGGGTSTSGTPTGLIAGTHFVTVTDANGCVANGSQTITEPTELISASYSEPATCYGYSDGKIWVETSNGTPPYSYEWSTGWADSVIVNTEAGIFSVTVTDSRGCQIVFEDLVVEQPNEVMVAIPSTPTICIGESVDLIMSVTSSPYSPYSYYWNGVLSTEMITVSPSETTTYTGQVIDSHGCESLVMETTVQVYEPLSSTVTVDKTEICKGEIVNVSLDIDGGNGNNIYTLDNGMVVSSDFVVQPEETQEFSVTISNDCSTPSITNTFEIVVNEPYLPSFHSDSKVGCNPLTTNFQQDVQEHAEGTEYVWTFGDFSTNAISFDPTPTHIFKTDGTFDVTLEITTPEGCKSSKTEYNYITVFPNPIAAFTANPSVASTINPNIYFENQSVGGDIWLWNFGDGDSTYAWNVSHNYQNFMNTYQVDLIAITEFGCVDTASSNVKIVDEVTFHIPTGFSPDNDGKNEVFRPYGNGIVNEGYSMVIYDRWGEIIFESTDLNTGWDGKIKDGSRGTVGIYTYIIKFTDTYGVPHERSGVVNLFR